MLSKFAYRRCSQISRFQFACLKLNWLSINYTALVEVYSLGNWLSIDLLDSLNELKHLALVSPLGFALDPAVLSPRRVCVPIIFCIDFRAVVVSLFHFSVSVFFKSVFDLVVECERLLWNWKLSQMHIQLSTVCTKCKWIRSLLSALAREWK